MTTFTPLTPRLTSLLAAAILFLTVGQCLPTWAQMGAGGGAPLQVSARLIEASSEGNAVAPELNDVKPLLQELLRFTSYQLVCARTFPAMNGLRVKLERGQTFVVSEVKRNEMTVSVDRGGKAVLSMRVVLVSGRPVIFNVPSTRGHNYFIVLNTR